MWNWLPNDTFKDAASMRYLCLIHLDESRLAAMARDEVNILDARHLDFNEGLRADGRFIEAGTLEPASGTACVRVRNGRASITDGPFAEAREQVAGFCFIEARDLNEAIRLASRIPSANLGTVEVRACREPIQPRRK
jgi:hypothetical protein